MNSIVDIIIFSFLNHVILCFSPLGCHIFRKQSNRLYRKYLPLKTIEITFTRTICGSSMCFKNRLLLCILVDGEENRQKILLRIIRILSRFHNRVNDEFPLKKICGAKNFLLKNLWSHKFQRKIL